MDAKRWLGLVADQWYSLDPSSWFVPQRPTGQKCPPIASSPPFVVSQSFTIYCCFQLLNSEDLHRSFYFFRFSSRINHGENNEKSESGHRLGRPLCRPQGCGDQSMDDVGFVVSSRWVLFFQPYDEGSNERGYGHAVIAGIARYPRKVTKRMGKKKQARRNKIKPFVKVLNYNHLMATR